jgi:ABC-2 type transport system permease protein/oleandomycin transport system permease protein
MTFGGFVTAIGLTDDLRKGLIDRFRSLPMARSAVLAGRTLADVATNAFQLVLMLLVGLLIGFDFNSNAVKIAGGILLMLMFGYAFSWVFAFIGLRSASPESAQALGFVAIFPITFASSAFAPPDSMPKPLEVFAENNPFSTIVDALRHLWVGAPAGNDVWGAVAWSVGLTLLFSWLAVSGYRKAVAK